MEALAAPLPDASLAYIPHYARLSEIFRQRLSSRGVEFRDFNIRNPSDALWPREYFTDENHMNAKGAERFSSEAFAQPVSGQ